VAQLDDPAARQAVLAERAFLRALGGGCQVPIGAATVHEQGRLRLRGAVLTPDGQRRLDGTMEGSPEAAEDLGQRLARDLLVRGAGELLHAR
jgi:hydroxymethylbilane synthase